MYVSILGKVEATVDPSSPPGGLCGIVVPLAIASLLLKSQMLVLDSKRCSNRLVLIFRRVHGDLVHEVVIHDGLAERLLMAILPLLIIVLVGKRTHLVAGRDHGRSLLVLDAEPVIDPWVVARVQVGRSATF